MRRLLRGCLLAYPRAVRERDGAYLLDLALELAGPRGGVRQALSLLRGGLTERLRRRRPAALLVPLVAAVLVVSGGVAVAATGSERVEVESCAAAIRDCTGSQTWADEWAEQKERQGWACERTESRDEVSWQCVAP